MKECLYSNTLPFADYSVAMAYVPWQKFDGINENLENAFKNGTIFPSLDKPFTGRRYE